MDDVDDVDDFATLVEEKWSSCADVFAILHHQSTTSASTWMTEALFTDTPRITTSTRIEVRPKHLPAQRTVRHDRSMSSAASPSSGKAPTFVPRFQRRTSERAYFEGAFKPGGMDYSSSLANDPDHPSGASPWATSPKQSRDFGPRANNDGPPAPTSLGSPAHQSTFGQSGSEGGQYANRSSTSDSTTVVDSENGEFQQSPYRTQQPQNPQYAQQYQQHDQQPPYQAAAEQRRPEAQRYHPRPQQKPHHPQYKLQCKITGLERTGKKDPILRFDAQV